MGHVFLSYSTTDRAYVERLAAQLRSAGIDVWYDHQTGTGEQWRDTIRHRVETCDTMIVVMTPAADASHWVTNEIDLAKSRHRPILTLLLDGEPLFGLRHIQFTDVRGGMLPDRSFVDRLRRPPAVRTHSILPPSPVTVVESARRRLTPVDPEQVQTLRGRGEMRCAQWSGDGTQLATASTGDGVWIWDALTGTTIRALKAIDFVRTIVTSEGPMAKAELKYVHWLTWSPDGSQLATIGTWGTARISSTITGAARASLEGHIDVAQAIAWSPDGRRVATGGTDTTARVWDPATGHSLRTLTGHAAAVSSVAWSPDSARLATASWDGTGGIWDADTGDGLCTFGDGAHVINAVAWSPDGGTLATAGTDLTTRLWAASDGAPLTVLTTLSDWVLSVAWSPDSTLLASGHRNGYTHLWDASNGKHLYALKDHGGPVHSVAWSPDGTRLATAGKDKAVCIWRVAR